MYTSASAEIAKYQIRNENFDAIKFHNFMMYHQAMLFPSIQMQQALHKKVCGAGFWEKHTKQREARSNGVYVSLAHFMMVRKCSFPHRDACSNHAHAPFAHSWKMCTSAATTAR